MRDNSYILKSLAMLVVLTTAIGLVFLRDSSVASGYPPPGTPVPPANVPLPYKTYLPIVFNNFQFPPPETTSYYVGSLSQLQSIATQLGQFDANTLGKQDHLVVLAFGGPGTGTIPGDPSTQFGAYMLRNRGFVSVAQMGSSARDFVLAWFSNLGSDTESRLFLVMGVSASGSGVTTGHATSFASAVTFARQGIAGCCGSRAQIVGGIDIETLPSPWVPTSTVKPWVDGYIAASNCVPGTAENGCLYDFGNAICPYPGFADCNSGWRRDDVWYVSYGARRTSDTNPFVLPIPQLYNTNGANALQWQNLSLYGATCTGTCQPITLNRKGKIFFPGIMTEVQACTQAATLGESCAGIDNPSWKSHTELFNALNKDPNTVQSFIRWTTDIKYQIFP